MPETTVANSREWAEGRTRAMVTWGLVSLVVQGFSMAGIKAVLSGSGIGPAEGVDLVWLILATLPLAATAGIVAWVCLTASRESRDPPYYYLAILVVASVLVSGYLSGQGYFEWFASNRRLGIAIPPQFPQPHLRGNVWQMAAQGIGVHFAFYGPATFVASVLVGAFCGYEAERSNARV